MMDGDGVAEGHGFKLEKGSWRDLASKPEFKVTVRSNGWDKKGVVIQLQVQVYIANIHTLLHHGSLSSVRSLLVVSSFQGDIRNDSRDRCSYKCTVSSLPNWSTSSTAVSTVKAIDPADLSVTWPSENTENGLLAFREARTSHKPRTRPVTVPYMRWRCKSAGPRYKDRSSWV